MPDLILQERIENKILLIRGLKVMLDKDLAELYGVSTGRLNEQVKRNIKRFPSDFMFQLNKIEFENWISQIAISNSSAKMGLRRSPYVFTEQGVAMLSGVLNSDRAIQVNIQIMRAFVKLRQIISTHKELAEKLIQLEKRMDKTDAEVRLIFEAIRQLMTPLPPIPQKPKKIGFLR